MALIVDDHWIEIDFGDVIGMIECKLRQLHHEIGQRLGVGCRQAAIRPENSRTFKAPEQCECCIAIERHRRERNVTHGLDQNAPEADHEQWAPARVAVDAEDQFAPGRRHSLHEYALDLRSGCMP